MITKPAAILITLTITAAEEVPAPAEDDPAHAALWLAVAAACLAIGIAASVAASSLLLYSPAKLGRALNGKRDRIIAKLTSHRASYHALTRSVAITGLVVAALLTWHCTDGLQRVIALLIFALLTLVGCGVLPGGFAESRAERVVQVTHRPIELLRIVLHYPIVVPVVAIGNTLLRLLRVPRPTKDDDDIADEILAAVEDKATETGLDEEERTWIENIVDLKDTQASEIMTPRTDAVAFDKDLPLLEAVEQATEAGFSRFPVFEDKVDNVIGVFYAKDALPLLGQNGDPSSAPTVGEYMRKPLFVPETMDVVDLLEQFRTSRVQMAIVLDEYGGTAGLVSIEDVLEEIVGEITDEYDTDQEIPIKVIEEQRVVETSGRVRIEEINEFLPIEIPEAENYDTVAGFVFTSLDRIPRVGESIDIGGVEFAVLEGDARRIHRLRLTVSKAALQS